MTSATWYNTSICKKLHGTVFEEFIRNARNDRYNLMCSIDAHEKQQPSSFDDGNGSGGNTLPSSSRTEALVSISAIIDLIYCWMQGLEYNLLERSNMYFENMKNIFQKIPVKLPKPPSHKEKRQSLLHAI